jgi:hypothetical protein
MTYQVKNRFQNFAFKWVNLHRYNAEHRAGALQHELDNAHGGAVHVELC